MDYFRVVDEPEVVFLLKIGARASTTVLCVEGDLDDARAGDLAALVSMAVRAPGIGEVALDLSRASFVDSATGLSTIAALQRSAESFGVPLRLCGSSPALANQIAEAGMTLLLA
jgi:anti-anti-sigma factor